MSKLVQKIGWSLNGVGFQKDLQTEFYMYGEADFKANKAMQEPLEKLYQYENQPDIREKVKEYIGGLESEIKRLEDEAESILAAIGEYDEKPMPSNYIKLVNKAEILQDVINDLKGILEEKYKLAINK